ncbi:hypothetical protein SAMN05421759_103137 [Roseivivax lentus]|uniref:Uncharacterized protein n=1 Tax=Roseivivax lentus TaxID=633194 RepID=A0A1N7LTF6_9RHOB|nr:hypothetical protein [Roseivivax lentus]SIS77049.1 hypothetical protein SAMN05421759_103137 [Roseivivax lentus]
MARRKAPPKRVNLLIVGQEGRLGYEAALFALSLNAHTTGDRFNLFIAEPQPGALWHHDPRIQSPELRALLEDQGATFLPFESRHFGHAYPYGNKIEALFALPEAEPFLFFDTDTLITGDLSAAPIDYARPTASLKREGTWPEIELYGPGYAATWKSLYDRFGLDFETSLDLTQPDEYWQRYLYFNAGFFYYKAARPFAERFLDYALTIRDDAPPELVCQSLDPWLDQVALPLVIHGLGGGRDALEPGWLDGRTTCHYRMLPMLYAREDQGVIDTLEAITAPNRVKKVLKEYEPIKRMVYQGRGAKVRALFDQDDLPRKEQAIRNKIKRNGFWMR